MDYVQMTLDDWMSLKKEIKEEFIKASASFVRKSEHLAQLCGTISHEFRQQVV